MSNNNNSGSNNTGRDGDKAKQVRAQVDEVVGIMQNNIEKVMQRGEHLDSLNQKTGIVYYDIIVSFN